MARNISTARGLKPIEFDLSSSIMHFLQGVTEDFMAIQNLERNDDATTVSTDSTFRQFEIYDA